MLCFIFIQIPTKLKCHKHMRRRAKISLFVEKHYIMRFALHHSFTIPLILLTKHTVKWYKFGLLRMRISIHLDS